MGCRVRPRASSSPMATCMSPIHVLQEVRREVEIGVPSNDRACGRGSACGRRRPLPPCRFAPSCARSSPAHPLGFSHVIADPALRAELAPKLESTAQSSLMGRFTLAGVCESVGPARCESECAVGQVEFRGPYACLRADEPPSPAAKRLRRCLEVDPVIGLAALPVPSGCRIL